MAVDDEAATQSEIEQFASTPEGQRVMQALGISGANGPKYIGPDGSTLPGDYQFYPQAPAGAVSDSEFLGQNIDPTYLYRQDTRFDNTAVKPRYEFGAEYQLANKTPDEIIAIQEAMERAGLYTGAWQRGNPADPATLAAYRQVLGTANVTGVDDKTALLNLVKSPKMKPPREPLTITLSNADDIKAVTDGISKNLYGGRMPDSTREAIANGIRADQESYARAKYDMEETGGVIDAPAGISLGSEGMDARIAKQIREIHPNESAATLMRGAFDTVKKTLLQDNSGGLRAPMPGRSM